MMYDFADQQNLASRPDRVGPESARLLQKVRGGERPCFTGGSHRGEDSGRRHFRCCRQVWTASSNFGILALSSETLRSAPSR